ncbi:ROK family transcriptional regulator [Streptomyces mangrovisoli]|uniref:ROK family transcriptional regulator n=1 Tax=Streptomyces mangrovisoli TaxID=1428628 RepID=UPI0009A0CEDC
MDPLSQHCCQSASRGDNGVVNGDADGDAGVGVGVDGGGDVSAGGRGARAVSGAGVNLLGLRSHNTALVLDLLRGAGAGGISRLELAERTGLTPQAVSKITGRLREEGLAAEAGRRASTGGKPRTVLRLVPEAGHAIGVHLDRDELRAVLVDLRGTVVAERRTELDLGAGADAVLTSVAAEVAALVTEVVTEAAEAAEAAVLTGGAPGGGDAVARTLLGVGVALPGPLDHAHGVLHRVTGYPEWDGFPLRDALAARLGVPVVVDKDTNAAALGLALGGAGGSFAYLHVGTGLGAGLVIGGGVHRGARTGAGEFGHQVIQLDGPPCGCGDRGCLEALCLTAVARGDLAEAARVLGAGAANLVGLLDIDRVLLGGRTVAGAAGAFVSGVATVLAARARREGVAGGAVPVAVAPGGARAIAEGAAQLVLAPVFGRAG